MRAVPIDSDLSRRFYEMVDDVNAGRRLPPLVTNEGHVMLSPSQPLIPYEIVKRLLKERP